MITFQNTEVMGWEAAIRGMRNPMNSWAKSDSEYCIYRDEIIADFCSNCEYNKETPYGCVGKERADKYIIGPNDYELMKKLRYAGSDHRKFMRMIVVYVDITAPLYWWKEFDTYKVGTVANSCSTMHKIADKRFEREDFSIEHLMDTTVTYLESTIDALNAFRNAYIETKDKDCWWQMIQLLPSSYNQKRTVMMSYEVLANIYKSRKNHKLDEWCEHSEEEIIKNALNGSFSLCDWIKTLPYCELITGNFKENE